MLEEEFAAGEEGPEHVLCGFSTRGVGVCAGERGCLREGSGVGRSFSGRWRAGESRQKRLFDELVVVREHLQKGGEVPLGMVEAVVDDVPVGQVKGLNEAGLIRTFTLTGDLALVPTERLQEVGAHGGVVQLGGLCSSGVKVCFFGASVVHHHGIELLRHPGDACDGVVEDFCHVTAWEVAGEVALIVRIAFHGRAGSLVGGAVEDEAHDFAQIKTVPSEVIGKGGQKGLVRSGIGRSEIIHGVDDPDAEKVRPDSVRDGAREVGV